MPLPRPTFLPQLLATSWCVSAALPAFAGRESDPNAPAAPAFRANVSAPFELTSPEVLIAANTVGDLLAQTEPTDLEPPQLTPPPRESAPVPAAPSESLAINLIKRLVQRGVLPKEDADDLMQAAENETLTARTQAAIQQQATIDAAVAQAVAAVQASGGGGGGAEVDPMLDAEGAVRVTYIPESVKAQLREEVRDEVMARAKEERWAAPRLLPEWTTRIRLFGDVRVRGEGVFFPEGNDNTGAFPNFNAINSGAPFDVSGTNFASQLNVDQDRYRIRLRVRIGVEADLGSGFSAGLRIATGENNSPVSTNQSFGLANQGQGGMFSKYNIWLDRGFLKYEAGPDLDHKLIATIGRFENPFFSTDIVWDDDVGFDGGAIQARYEVARGLVPYLTAGVFPVFNTDFNFGTNQPAKFKSTDKWLYAGQLGADWKLHKDFQFKFGVAYYHFDNVEGQLSDPFLPLSSSDQGNTDNTRPSFAQKGNTYRPIRRIIASPLNNFGTSNQFQYFGLATPFQELALTGRLDYTRWEPFQLSLTGEWIKNLAFDSGRIDQFAVNNRGPDGGDGTLGRFAGGDTAWIVNLRGGSATLAKFGDFQVGVNYRFIESDAVVDAFTDSDFGLGGTNLKGFTIYGALALSSRVAVSLRWLSADEIAGPPLSVDILQLDVSGKF